MELLPLVLTERVEGGLKALDMADCFEWRRRGSLLEGMVNGMFGQRIPTVGGQLYAVGSAESEISIWLWLLAPNAKFYLDIAFPQSNLQM